MIQPKLVVFSQCSRLLIRPPSWINRFTLPVKKVQGSVVAGELTPGIPSKSQEYLQMKEVHVASAPVICKSRATESRGEGIDLKSISEAIKGQLHAHREGPQHAAAGPVVSDTLQGWHVLPLIGNQKPRGCSKPGAALPLLEPQ